MKASSVGRHAAFCCSSVSTHFCVTFFEVSSERDWAFSCFVLSEGVFIIGGNIAYDEKKPVSSRELCYSKYCRATFMQILAENRAAKRKENVTAITIKKALSY